MEESGVSDDSGSIQMMAPAGSFARQIALTVIRWFLGVTFIASALGKIADPTGFADIVAAYRILPIWAINVSALVLPWLELMVGFSLFSRTANMSGALLAAVINAVFLAAVISAMCRGLDIECGCFTIAKSNVGWELVFRDVSFLALSLILLIAQPTEGKERQSSLRAS